MSRKFLLIGTVALSALLSVPATAQNPGWFVPQQSAPAAPAPAPKSHGVARHAAPVATQVPVAPIGPDAPIGEDAQSTAQMPPLPPVPELPALPKAAPPPTAVIGVLGVPEAMRASLAAQAVEKTIRERREKLNQDAQKELSAEREMQQSLSNDHAKLSTEQQHEREHALQDRSAKAQHEFRERNAVIQQAAQYGLNQIERMLIAVIRQVSESHGMNLVVHRAQVALNVNEFDITTQVAEQLNKVLPSVDVPPDGVPIMQYLAQKKTNGGAADAKTAPDSPAQAAPKH